MFGLWESPITALSLANDLRLESACWDSDGRTLVWLEDRGGRGVLVAENGAGDAPRELNPELSARAEVGYGGGDFTVHAGNVFFSAHSTGRIYRRSLDGGEARPVTPPFGKSASPTVSPDGRWVVYVHHDDDQVDRLAIVDAEGNRWPHVLVDGHDFYMQPRWSPDGRWFSWIAWDHPNMPWDGTTLYLAPVIEPAEHYPKLGEARVVAGGPEAAIFQPEFTPDGRRLLYISDERGWGQIVAYDLESGRRQWLTPEGLEYGLPAWRQGVRTYAISHDSRFVTGVRNENGFMHVERIDLETAERVTVDALGQYCEAVQVTSAPDSDRVVLIGSNPKVPSRIAEHSFADQRTRVVARSSAEMIEPEVLADCRSMSWPTGDGDTAHGLFYAPAGSNGGWTGSPPLVVLIHGGPTSQVRAGWRADAQFFATRGYAVLYVNYRGSTGYGRKYMLKLRGNWGICDVEDAVSGTRHLVDAGVVDPHRAVIMGGSAGGFTVLETLARHPEVFAAGVCLYGVANQFHLALQTHKFESRYLDSLLGPLPEAASVYRERSPVFHAERICRPLAIFQGDKDRVVPREQSDTIVAALRRNGTPHVYHVYEGEGHGWRKQETIEHFYRALEEFLKRYVLFA